MPARGRNHGRGGPPIESHQPPVPKQRYILFNHSSHQARPARLNMAGLWFRCRDAEPRWPGSATVSGWKIMPRDEVILFRK